VLAPVVLSHGGGGREREVNESGTGGAGERPSGGTWTGAGDARLPARARGADAIA